MAKTALYNMEGAAIGEIELSDAIFASDVNVAAMHLVVRSYLAAQRQGTQSAKTRTEVRGGGRKIYRQKGTGNARHHGNRAPQFRHGGVVFAPKPRDYVIAVPKKVRRLAFKSALTSKLNDGDIIVVDCGMAFPGDDMYGIDCVIPDVTYLVKNHNRLRGLFITHGHEDHIGAVPYVLKELDVPIYTMPLTAALIELKLEEHDLLYNTQIFTKKVGSSFRLGAFTIEFINVNHSIPDAVALAIGTPIGTVIHTGDFKIDSTPIDGEVIDLARFGELGKQGVLALLADSTNVERPGYTMSERAVGATFKRQFTGLSLIHI